MTDARKAERTGRSRRRAGADETPGTYVRDLASRKGKPPTQDERLGATQADLTRAVQELEGEVRDRIRAEKVLRASEEKYRMLVEHIPAITYVVALDDGGTYLYVSPRVESILGCPAEEYQRSSALRREMLHEEDRGRVQAAFDYALRNGVSFSLEYRMLARDGRVVWFRNEGETIRDAEGHPLFFQGLMHDISEIRLAQRALRESEKLAATGRMAARIAHEINNPLGGIKNSFLLIRDAVREDHPYQQYVGRIEREIERIARIVRQMFTVHRPVREGPTEFEPVEVIEDIAVLLESDCRVHEVTIDIEVRQPVATVFMEKDSLFQVLYNVLHNAIEASPKRGRVTVTVRVAGRRLSLSVADQGDGIPESVRPHLFEPFFTTKSVTRGANAGLGLGLSVSRGLVEAMGGSLSFASQTGWGTVFQIKLPLKQRPTERAERTT